MVQVVEFVRPRWYQRGGFAIERRECFSHNVCQQLEHDLKKINNNDDNNNYSRKRKRRCIEEWDTSGVVEPFSYHHNPNDRYVRWNGMSIYEGDKLDIPTLLTSPSRDYLITYNRDIVIVLLNVVMLIRLVFVHLIICILTKVLIYIFVRFELKITYLANEFFSGFGICPNLSLCIILWLIAFSKTRKKYIKSTRPRKCLRLCLLH